MKKLGILGSGENCERVNQMGSKCNPEMFFQVATFNLRVLLHELDMEGL